MSNGVLGLPVHVPHMAWIRFQTPPFALLVTALFVLTHMPSADAVPSPDRIPISVDQDPCDRGGFATVPKMTGINGELDWSIGAVYNPDCSISVATPLLPAYVETGSVDPPYRIDQHGAVCKRSEPIGFDRWSYTMFVTAEISKTTYRGSLPFVGESTITINVPTKDWRSPTYKHSYEGPFSKPECEASLAADQKAAWTAATDWVKNNLPAGALYPSTGKVSLIPMTGGGHLVTTGTMHGLCEFVFNLVPAWELVCDFVFQSAGGLVVLAHATGASFFVSPTATDPALGNAELVTTELQNRGVTPGNLEAQANEAYRDGEALFKEGRRTVNQSTAELQANWRRWSGEIASLLAAL